MKRAVAVFMLVTAATSSHAGPFGLSFGESYAKLSKFGLIKNDKGLAYTAKSVPNPHRDFDE